MGASRKALPQEVASERHPSAQPSVGSKSRLGDPFAEQLSGSGGPGLALRKSSAVIRMQEALHFWLLTF